MAEKGLITKDTLTAIADAIRAKTETSATMLPGEMAALISAIETGSTATFKEGSFKVSTQGDTVSIGAAVDVSRDYLFYAYTTNTGSNSKYSLVKGVRISCINGSKTVKVEIMYTDGTTGSSSSSTSATLSSNGSLKTTYTFSKSEDFKWVFASWG